MSSPAPPTTSTATATPTPATAPTSLWMSRTCANTCPLTTSSSPRTTATSTSCVGGPGDRKVLRFGTMIGNIGNADLAIGPPGQGPDAKGSTDACHDHYHYEDYAFYQLFTEAGHELSSIGYKNGWCVLDLTEYWARASAQTVATPSCGNPGDLGGLRGHLFIGARVPMDRCHRRPRRRVHTARDHQPQKPRARASLQ